MPPNRFHFADDPVYGTNRLPAAPAYAARGEVMYKHAGGIYAGPTFDLVGKRYADFANSYTVDAYGLMGLRAGFSARRWDIFGEVRTCSTPTTSPPSASSTWPPPMHACCIPAHRCRLTRACGIRSSEGSVNGRIARGRDDSAPMMKAARSLYDGTEGPRS